MKTSDPQATEQFPSQMSDNKVEHIQWLLVFIIDIDTDKQTNTDCC